MNDINLCVLSNICKFLTFEDGLHLAQTNKKLYGKIYKLPQFAYLKCLNSSKSFQSLKSLKWLISLNSDDVIDHLYYIWNPKLEICYYVDNIWVKYMRHIINLYLLFQIELNLTNVMIIEYYLAYYMINYNNSRLKKLISRIHIILIVVGLILSFSTTCLILNKFIICYYIKCQVLKYIELYREYDDKPSKLFKLFKLFKLVMATRDPHNLGQLMWQKLVYKLCEKEKQELIVLSVYYDNLEMFNLIYSSIDLQSSMDVLRNELFSLKVPLICILFSKIIQDDNLKFYICLDYYKDYYEVDINTFISYFKPAKIMAYRNK